MHRRDGKLWHVRKIILRKRVAHTLLPLQMRLALMCHIKRPFNHPASYLRCHYLFIEVTPWLNQNCVHKRATLSNLPVIKRNIQQSENKSKSNKKGKEKTRKREKSADRRQRIAYDWREKSIARPKLTPRTDRNDCKQRSKLNTLNIVFMRRVLFFFFFFCFNVAVGTAVPMNGSEQRQIDCCDKQIADTWHLRWHVFNFEFRRLIKIWTISHIIIVGPKILIGNKIIFSFRCFTDSLLIKY